MSFHREERTVVWTANLMSMKERMWWIKSSGNVLILSSPAGMIVEFLCRNSMRMLKNSFSRYIF